MDSRHPLRVCLLVAALLFLGGCETAQLTDNTMDASAVGRNEVKLAVGNNVKAVNSAVEEVCEDLNLDRLSRSGDLLIWHYVYRSEEKEHITIYTRATSAISTEVRIQYGLQGNPQHPNDILERLQDYSVYRVAFDESGDSERVAIK